jgi:ParB family transcriptional regulator, chromosome partitioning protein
MSRKRRIFDIELPEEDAPAPTEAAPVEAAPQRRGPMATAIGETAAALRERQAREAEIRAENDALAHELVRLKREGLVVDLIPVEAVHADKLLRDRARRIDGDLDELKASIRDVGLSNPIRVEQVGPDRFELIQGWRRLSAFRELLAETGEERFARIPAGLSARGEGLDALYRRMVDENMVRKDISFAEMANLARGYVDRAKLEGKEVDLDQAVNLLFASAGPQKRSYIRRFAWLLQRLGKVLEHPEAIPRALGMTLASRLDAQPDLLGPVAGALRDAGRRSADEELAILRRFAEGQGVSTPPPGQGPRRGRPPAVRAKTSLRVMRDGQEVHCTATSGRVELRMQRDFSAVDRPRLEAALSAFLEALDRER